MTKNVPIAITVISAVVALVSITSAFSSSSKHKAKIASLRDQIARMQAYIPDKDAEIVTQYKADPKNTNNLTSLQTLLTEKDAEIVALKSSPKVTETEERPPRESWEDRMARMKAEEPEEYAEMIQRREERQTEMRYNLAERTATFLDLDTSNMTQEELANHEALVEKMSHVWALTEQFQDPQASPDREAMQELFTEMREVRPLMQEERTIMFKQLGTDLGYKGKDAQDFATHLTDIIDATTIQSPRGGGGSRGGRGGGGR